MGTTVVKNGQPGSKALFKDSFLLHKLHSLSGIVPIGLFMIFHLTANSYSLRGEVEFNTTVKVIGFAPFVQLLEIAVIFAPILFHAIYGFFIIAEMQGPGGNVSHYGYGRNWLYVLQRWSGVLAFAYIAFHTYDTTIGKYLIEVTKGEAGHELGFQSISYKAMAWRLADPLYLGFYLLGIAAAAFHLGNGLLNFAIRWGLAIGKEAQKITAAIGLLVGLGLTVLGWAIAINFAMKGAPIRVANPTLDGLLQAEAAKVQTPHAMQTETGKTDAASTNGKTIIPDESIKTNALPTDAEVAQYYDFRKKLLENQFPGKPFETVMKEQGSTPEEVKNEIKRQLTETNADAMRLKVTEDDVRKAFGSFKGEYLPARVQLRLIVTNPRTLEFAKAKKLLDAKTPFEEVAKKINMPQLKATGGLMPQATPIAQINAKYRNEVQKRSAGDFFGPVDFTIAVGSPPGKAWIKVEKKLPAWNATYDEARQDVLRQVVEQRMSVPGLIGKGLL